jgi:superfamily II DNA or RNA helicase
VARIDSALEEFGGALLSDEVGMGKTFVASAVARPFSHCLVVAPAALASMWRDALAATETNADFISFEQLSRSGGDRGSGLADDPAKSSAPASCTRYDLVIVDEAHHARNPATRR